MLKARTLYRCALALTLLACSKPEDAVEIDGPALKAQLERRAETVGARPTIVSAGEQLVEKALADAALAQKGEALLGALGESAELQPAFRRFQDRAAELPAMQRLVRELVRANRGASTERIGELAGEWIDGATGSEEFDRAFDREMDALLARPSVDAAFEQIAKAIVANDHFKRAVRAALLNQATDLAVRRRLVELNGGEAPDAPRTTQLLLDGPFAEARLERLYLQLLVLPVVEQQLIVAFGELAASPAFAAQTRALLATLFADEAFERGLMEAFAALLDEQRDAEAYAAAMHVPFSAPVAESAVADFVHAVRADPELQAIGDRALAKVAVDPAFGKTVAALVTDWLRAPTPD